MQNTIKPALQITFTYIGTVVGAGFASGREILEFFVQYGMQGFIGILLATALFVWAGVRVMLIAHRIQAESYQDISVYLFGRTIGSLFNLILLTVLLGTTSVMLAATGALFAESFHLPAQLGIWLSMVCIFWVSQKGLRGIHSVNSLFVPTLFGFTCLVFLHAQPWLAEGSSLVEAAKPWAWISSPLYYVALNVTLAQAVLVPIGKESQTEKPLIVGGILGGVGIGFLLLLAYASMIVHLPDIHRAQMPMIALLAGLGKGITTVFAVLVFAEVFSTLVANVFGLVQQVRQLVPISASFLSLFILTICYLISFIGFRSLLALLYPLFGQFVVLFLLMLFWRQWKPKQ
ncbi:GerAB/ArcD/ProY family transporter [Brevibacillus sp. SYP-B805]|uniref:YkvI family membrane protein n=1 Tax=Brevibacillus sp. SYP-B805 TaxID=1578199 RepID=UPI0013EB33F6|nr:GerAB/ArcD/ProY family transporter [Brevibacillus sp. SYP-B805]NGQ96386.1 GerAB/ArcD/ProY family transporter [Brevibacillus sp. SYP-B805]